MPFHLNTVYFQWFRKGTPRIISFVLSPLSGAFFSYYIEIGYFIYSSESCFPYRKRVSVKKKKERKLKCVG